MTSRDHEGKTRNHNTHGVSPISRKQLEMLFSNNC